MNYNEFIKTYDGKAIDYDGGAGVQCVDLIKLYLDKVFNIKPLSIGNAHCYFDDYNKYSFLYQNFDRIVNSPEFIPKKGDIACWGLNFSKYGHVAIATGDGTPNYFYSYDQNWGIKAMHKVFHDYKGFSGVLRPKKQYLLDYTEKQDYLLEVENMKTYVNGSTPEVVYGDSNCTIKIGELSPRETCYCLVIKENKAIVFYKVNGTNNHKIGFVKWLGGVR